MVSDRRIFGERLKRHRERRGISLEAISASSKIPASLFVGLEKGDCSRWPAAIYGRAYLRAYANAIGVNADDAVEEFTELFATIVKVDGVEVAAAQPRRAAGTLRLSMGEEPVITPALIARRAALAAVDLLIGFLIAAVAQVGFGAGVWSTVAAALAYYTVGRLISNEPLLYWIYLRIRHSRAEEPAPSEAQAPVADAASTAA